MGKIRLWSFLMVIQMLVLAQTGTAEEEAKNIGEIQVVAPREDKGVVLAPKATVINVQDYETPGIAQNIGDILKDRAMVDFRDEGSLVPDDDTFYLKSFEATRFTTALDGLALSQTGGRKSSHIVDYALLPTFLIDKIELLPGPHSALYPGKSIGGVINLITKRPEKYPSLKPEAHVSNSYASYGTQHNNMTVRGGADSLIYDVAYDRYHTDGYLRNQEADIDTWYGRLGYILPSDGFVTFSASVSDADRQIPVDNLPGAAGYDPDYPEADTSLNYQIPASWDSEAYNYRINLEQLTPIGLWTAGWLDSKQNRQRNYSSGSGTFTKSETVYWQEGARIQDEIRISENHTTTVGYDMAILSDNGVSTERKAERVNRDGWYAQHEWAITPRLDLTAGLRYEDVKIRVTNSGPNRNTSYPGIVQRSWDDLQPKSFLTYELDDLAGALRDTSISVGVSRIWHAPDSHGTYNGQGIPSGIFLEPEHGIGYDFIFNRRLWNDVKFKVDYGLYEIDDYIVQNSVFYDHRAAGDPLRFSDYKLNLKDTVRRHGVDVEVGGHLLDDLSFYLTYSWQYAVYKGPEPAGQTDLDQRAKHRATAGLQYNLFENTLLMADVTHQSNEVTDVYDPVTEEVIGTTQIDAHEVVNLGIQQTLFKEWGLLKDGRLKFYVNNVCNERYKNSDGLPATDQVYGTALSFGF